MGGLNEADRLKKGSVSKPWIGDLRVATEGPTAHPRRALPTDEALVAHIMRNGMHGADGRPWRPAKLVACANAVFAGPDPGGEDAVFARGFAAALKFAAGEKTGRLPKIVTAAIKASDNRGGKKS